MIATCQHCGKKYEAEKSGRKFCSLTCSGYGRENKVQKMPSLWLNCAVCLYRAGLGKRRIAKVIKTASAHTVLLRLKEALGDAYGQSMPLTRQKTEPKPKKQRPPKKTKEEKARLQKEYGLAYYYANHQENKQRIAKAARQRYKELYRVDPAFTCKRVLKRSVKRLVRYTGTRKKESSVTYLGCSMLEARAHIERQFVRGMSWSNYGTAWEIDHIMPLAAFDLTNKDHVAQAGHYTNLRPLWKYANRAKGDKIEPHQASLLI